MTSTVLPAPTLDRTVSRWPVAALVGCGVAMFLSLVGLFWVGVLGSDDSIYWDGASGWLAHVPYVGTTHWTLRHPLVVPVALARRLLGDGPAALVVPTMLYACAAIAVIGVWTARAAGLLAAGFALALVATQPQFVLVSSTATIDVSELFFILAAFALIHREADRLRPRAAVLLLAGVSLGFAMLCRETTAFAVAAVGLLFLAGFGFHRAWYVLLGAGFLIPVGAEELLLWWRTGDKLYRASIAVHHDSTIDRWVEQGSGVPALHPAVDPAVMLLFKHDFGLLFWAAIPLFAWLLRRGLGDSSQRRLVVLVLTLAATWAVLAAGLWSLLPLTPRYFLLPSLLVAVGCGVALGRLWAEGWRRVAAVVAAGLVATNIGALALDNRNFMFGERVLADVAARRGEPIYTDAQTLRRAALLLRWRGVEGRVTDLRPAVGDLFFYNPSRVEITPPVRWQAVENHALPPSFGQEVLDKLVGEDRVPPGVWERLGRGHEPVTLYRVR